METVTQEHIFSFRQKPNSFSVLMQDAFLELQQGHNNSLSSPNLTLGMATPLRERWYYTTAFLRILFFKVLSTDRNYCLSFTSTKTLLLTLMKKEFQQQWMPLRIPPGKICYRNMNTGINAVWTEICSCKHQKKQTDRVLKRACIANETRPRLWQCHIHCSYLP